MTSSQLKYKKWDTMLIWVKSVIHILNIVQNSLFNNLGSKRLLNEIFTDEYKIHIYTTIIFKFYIQWTDLKKRFVFS